MTDESVAVLIITFNAESTIQQCLDSIHAQSTKASEIVVVDCGSKDRTREIIERSSNTSFVIGAQGFAVQRNLGAFTSKSKFLLFVDSDMVLGRDVISECLSLSIGGASAVVIPEEFCGNGYWGRVRWFERTFYDNVPWIEAARWISRDAFNAIGGFDESLSLGEEWDFDERIRKSFRLGRCASYIYCLEGRLYLRDLLRKKAFYAQSSHSFEKFKALHPDRAAKLFSPFERIRLFASRPRAFVEHPLLAAGLLVLGLGELAIVRSETIQERLASNPWANRHKGP